MSIKKFSVGIISLFLLAAIFAPSISANENKNNIRSEGGGSEYNWTTDYVINGDIETDQAVTGIIAELGSRVMPEVPFSQLNEIAGMFAKRGYDNLWYTRYKQKGSKYGAPYTRTITYFFSDSEKNSLVKKEVGPPVRSKY
ncbi:MAG TPA: hypothetical protein VK111_12540 [Virgibacillus sp.]|nr:hypothetical protein [Virgibacillus sp.]